MEASLDLERRRQMLFDAVRELPAADRKVVLLHLEGLSHTEIHEVTGDSPGAIATRLSRIRERLSAAVNKRPV
jgi:RNA polymerase sigma-70 factor (ECF subfamily)